MGISDVSLVLHYLCRNQQSLREGRAQGALTGNPVVAGLDKKGSQSLPLWKVHIRSSVLPKQHIISRVHDMLLTELSLWSWLFLSFARP